MRWLSEAHPVTPLGGLPVISSTLHVTAEQQVTADQVHGAKDRHLTSRAVDRKFKSGRIPEEAPSPPKALAQWH